MLADMLDLEPSDEKFDAKLKVLKEEVLHHVEEEEKEMFKEVRKMFPKEAREALGAEMLALAEQLKDQDLVDRIPGETLEAPPLQQ